MSEARCRWVACWLTLMMACLTAGAATKVDLLLIKGKSGGTPGGELRRVCPHESNFAVYSPGLVVHTMKAEEMADPPAALRTVFGQGDSRTVFEHALACDACPEGSTTGGSVSTSLDGRDYALGVVFPGKGEDPDVYRVRIQEMRAVPATAKKEGATGGVIPPTLLNVPVRCPRGHVGVVGFSDFKGEPLFLVLKPAEAKGE